MMADRSCTFLFIDCETTGLDPERHEIVEFAAVRMEYTGSCFVKRHEYDKLVLPDHIETADPEALAICAYDQELWDDCAISRKEFLAALPGLFEGVDAIGGHNPQFDLKFLRKEAPFLVNLPRRVVDTTTIGWLLRIAGRSESASLEASMKACNFTHRPHRALSDAKGSFELFEYACKWVPTGRKKRRI